MPNPPRRDLSNLPLASLNKMPNAATAIRYPPRLVVAMHRCSHSNDLSRNKKKCCFSCQAWRNGLAPLSAKGGGTSAKDGGASTSGGAASDVGLVSDDTTCHDENGPPNNASPRRDRSPKRGEKRKSPSRGLGGVLCPSTPPERIRRQAPLTMPNFLLLAITLQDTTCLVGIRDFSSFSLLVITIIYSLLLPSYLSANSNIHSVSVAPPLPPWKFIRCTRFFALDANSLPSDTTLWPEEMEPAPPLPSPRTAAPRAPPSPLEFGLDFRERLLQSLLPPGVLPLRLGHGRPELGHVLEGRHVVNRRREHHLLNEAVQVPGRRRHFPSGTTPRRRRARRSRAPPPPSPTNPPSSSD
jgi:hypothetical protein